MSVDVVEQICFQSVRFDYPYVVQQSGDESAYAVQICHVGFEQPAFGCDLRDILLRQRILLQKEVARQQPQFQSDMYSRRPYHTENVDESLLVFGFVLPSVVENFDAVDAGRS